jgi:hypothetical protein
LRHTPITFCLIFGGNLDLAPDAMYQAIKAHGEWILR